MKVRTQHPLSLDLPGGRVTHVFGSARSGDDAQLYEFEDGTRVALDTRIPNDLAGRWFWSGCTGLSLVVAPGECSYTIATVSYPPPGVEAPLGRDCYTVARDYEVRELALEAPRQEARQPKRKAQAVRVEAAQIEQAVMDL